MRGDSLTAAAPARTPPRALLRLVLLGRNLVLLLGGSLLLRGRLGDLCLPSRRLASRLLGLGLRRDRLLRRLAADERGVGRAVERALDAHLHLLADEAGRVRHADVVAVARPDSRRRVAAP